MTLAVTIPTRQGFCIGIDSLASSIYTNSITVNTVKEIFMHFSKEIISKPDLQKGLDDFKQELFGILDNKNNVITNAVSKQTSAKKLWPMFYHATHDKFMGCMILVGTVTFPYVLEYKGEKFIFEIDLVDLAAELSNLQFTKEFTEDNRMGSAIYGEIKRISAEMLFQNLNNICYQIANNKGIEDVESLKMEIIKGLEPEDETKECLIGFFLYNPHREEYQQILLAITPNKLFKLGGENIKLEFGDVQINAFGIKDIVDRLILGVCGANLKNFKFFSAKRTFDAIVDFYSIIEKHIITEDDQIAKAVQELLGMKKELSLLKKALNKYPQLAVTIEKIQKSVDIIEKYLVIFPFLSKENILFDENDAIDILRDENRKYDREQPGFSENQESFFLDAYGDYLDDVKLKNGKFLKDFVLHYHKLHKKIFRDDTTLELRLLAGDTNLSNKTLAIRDGIFLVNFLIETTIQTQIYFSERQQFVGGEIYLGLIEGSKGFRYVKDVNEVY